MHGYYHPPWLRLCRERQMTSNQSSLCLFPAKVEPREPAQIGQNTLTLGNEIYVHVFRGQLHTLGASFQVSHVPPCRTATARNAIAALQMQHRRARERQGLEYACLWRRRNVPVICRWSTALLPPLIPSQDCLTILHTGFPFLQVVNPHKNCQLGLPSGHLRGTSTGGSLVLVYPQLRHPCSCQLYQ